LPADSSEKAKLIHQIEEKVKEFEHIFEKHGTGKEWILADIPKKDVIFTHGLQSVIKRRKQDILYREPEPVKVVSRDGHPALLVERENILMKHLSGFINFVPSVYANDSALNLLKSRNLI
jgi:hypothetical protein